MKQTKTLYLYLKKEYLLGAHLKLSDNVIRITKTQKKYVDEYSFEQGYLNTPQVISSFIDYLQLDAPAQSLALALEPPLIQEIFSNTPDMNSHTPLSEHQTIHIHSDGMKSYFYHCGISYPQLLQYFLAAHKHKLSITRLSSAWFSYYTCYQQLHAHDFRSAQLYQDMQKVGSSLINYFSPELVSRFCMVDEQVSHEINLHDTIVLSGLFLSQKDV